MSELRLRIFRLVEERQRAGRSEMPTAGEIAEVLGEPLRNVVVTLRSSEAIGQVWLPIGLDEQDKDIPVVLKPAAFIYLEANLQN
jgi:hypothetical protein